MAYKKVKLVFDDAKDRLTRTLLVDENTNLVILGAIFCVALRTEFEHNFLFIKNKTHYSPDVFLAEGPSGLIKEFPMKEYKLKDLGSNFNFLYDTGDYWLFNCEVYGEVEVEDNKLAYLIDGKRQGVWEDNKYTLMHYIEGRIDPECDEDDSSKGYSLPWNFDNTKYGDFDIFDIEDASRLFEFELVAKVNEYLSGCHDNGFELEVNLVKKEKNKRAMLFNIIGENTDVEDLVINKTKKDLMTSLKNINKDYAKKYMKENFLDSYSEWKEEVLTSFKNSFEASKTNAATIDFFNRLVINENTSNIVAFADDVIYNNIFLYREDGVLKYYIPDEIKTIIWNELSKYKKHLN